MCRFFVSDDGIISQISQNNILRIGGFVKTQGKTALKCKQWINTERYFNQSVGHCKISMLNLKSFSHLLEIFCTNSTDNYQLRPLNILSFLDLGTCVRNDDWESPTSAITIDSLTMDGVCTSCTVFILARIYHFLSGRSAVLIFCGSPVEHLYREIWPPGCRHLTPPISPHSQIQSNPNPNPNPQ